MPFRITPELLFFVNGFLVAIIVFQCVRFLRSRGQQNQFKDSLWEGTTNPRIVGPAEEEVQKVVDTLAWEGSKNPVQEDTKKVYRKRKKVPNFEGSPYEVLTVSPGASREEILSSYKYWIQRYHPDRVQHLGPGYIKQATYRSEQLNKARNILLKKNT